MPSRPWFRWYPGDYLADTLHLSEEEDLLYRRLIDLMWIYGPLPEDPREISKISRIDLRKIRKRLPRILPLLQCTNGKLDHPRIAEQRAEAEEIKEKRTAAGRKGGIANAKARAFAHPRARPDPDLRSKPKPKDQDQNRLPEAENGRMLLLLPAADGSEVPITEADAGVWQSQYPGVDAEAELHKAHAWLDANPRRKKTPRGMRAFVVNWLSRAQDRARG